MQAMSTIPEEASSDAARNLCALPSFLDEQSDVGEDCHWMFDEEGQASGAPPAELRAFVAMEEAAGDDELLLRSFHLQAGTLQDAASSADPSESFAEPASSAQSAATVGGQASSDCPGGWSGFQQAWAKPADDESSEAGVEEEYPGSSLPRAQEAEDSVEQEAAQEEAPEVAEPAGLESEESAEARQLRLLLERVAWQGLEALKEPEDADSVEEQAAEPEDADSVEEQAASQPAAQEQAAEEEASGVSWIGFGASSWSWDPRSREVEAPVQYVDTIDPWMVGSCLARVDWFWGASMFGQAEPLPQSRLFQLHPAPPKIMLRGLDVRRCQAWERDTVLAFDFRWGQDEAVNGGRPCLEAHGFLVVLKDEGMHWGLGAAWGMGFPSDSPLSFAPPLLLDASGLLHLMGEGRRRVAADIADCAEQVEELVGAFHWAVWAACQDLRGLAERVDLNQMD